MTASARQIKLSVILPSYNVGSYIEECLESVIHQSLMDIEILCVDAGSTDGTLEILEKYAADDDRIHLLHSEKKSYGHQMNLGLAAAKGEYIGIVETDDFIASEMYESLVRIADNAKADIAKGNFWYYYSFEDGTPSQKKLHNMPDLPEGKVLSLPDCPALLRGHPSIWSAVYRRDFLKKINVSFVEEPGGGWVDNPFLFETMCAAERVVWTAEPYYFYRQTNPNSSSNRQPDLTVPFRRMMDNLDVVEKNRITDRQTLVYVYERIWNTIRDAQQREEYPGQVQLVIPWVRKLLMRLDAGFVDENFGFSERYLFYTNISPLREVENEDIDQQVNISPSDMKLILSENAFLHSVIGPARNAALDLESIENGISYRLGRFLTLPLRRIRDLTVKK